MLLGVFSHFEQIADRVDQRLDLASSLHKELLFFFIIIIGASVNRLFMSCCFGDVCFRTFWRVLQFFSTCGAPRTSYARSRFRIPEEKKKKKKTPYGLGCSGPVQKPKEWRRRKKKERRQERSCSSWVSFLSFCFTF